MKLPRVLALTPGDAHGSDTQRVLHSVRIALDAGLGGVLLREPFLSDREWLALAREIRAACDAVGGVWFGVHDRAYAAQAAGADAIHLSSRSLAPGLLRDRFGDRFAYGLSTHAADLEREPDANAWDAADYIFHGPVKAPRSKRSGAPDRLPAIGFDGLAACARRSACPVLALGGMTPDDVAPALAAGAHGVAVLSGILPSADPASATHAYLAALAHE